MSNDSNYIFKIDDVIFFNPKENKLINIESEKQISLYITCSRCLSILLDNYNGIVSQNDILEFAWPDNHKVVSYNTFYQCVLNLRKAFFQIDYHKKIIITVPKKGLSIATDITISKVASSHESDINKKLSMYSDSIYIDDYENDNNLLIEEMFVDTDRHNRIYVIILILAALVMTAAVSAYYYLNTNFFSNYTEYTSSDTECHVYINEGESTVAQSKNFIEQEKEICRGNRYVYLTLYQNTKRASAIVCKRRMNYFTNNSCASYYYPAYEGAHEKDK